jgi:Protein of unknown function (DUF3455)
MSCFYGTSLFHTIQDHLYSAWANATDVTVQNLIEYSPAILAADLIMGQHYYVPNPLGSGLSPKWDLRATERFRGASNAYVIGKANATLPDPYDPKVDVPWVKLDRVAGSIADEIFRIDTVGGQPPASVRFFFWRGGLFYSLNSVSDLGSNSACMDLHLI